MDSYLFLENARLRVQIARPGAVYRGARFGWSGFVTQVTLDDSHTFCAREPQVGPREGGAGLCHEFGIFAPIGYDEAAPGEWFPKLGVGLLQKLADEEWSFARNYPIEPFPTTLQTREDRLHFSMEPIECRGYGARFEQILRLEENRLIFDCKLENVGEKRLQTHEYRHNFLALGGENPAPGLKLRTSFPLRRPPREHNGNEIPAEEVLELGSDEKGALIEWKTRVETAFMEPFEGFQASQKTGSAWWEMENTEGLKIRETIDQPLCGFNVWSAPTVYSPEAFIEINLAPGEKMNWRRVYRFEL